MMTSKLLVLYLGAVIASYIVEGSLLKLNVKYQNHDAVEPDSFLLSCVPDLGGDCDKSLLYLKVSRNNQLIASIKGGDAISYGYMIEHSVEVQGVIDQDDPSKSFLDVTFKNVVKEDSGVYTCTAAYLGVMGDFSRDVASANVSITNVETKDLARRLMAKASLLDSIIKHNDNTTRAKLSEVEMNIVTHGAELKLLLDQVTKLEQSLRRQEGILARKIREMEAKLEV